MFLTVIFSLYIATALPNATSVPTSSALSTSTSTQSQISSSQTPSPSPSFSHSPKVHPSISSVILPPYSADSNHKANENSSIPLGQCMHLIALVRNIRFYHLYLLKHALIHVKDARQPQISYRPYFNPLEYIINGAILINLHSKVRHIKLAIHFCNQLSKDHHSHCPPCHPPTIPFPKTSPHPP